MVTRCPLALESSSAQGFFAFPIPGSLLPGSALAPSHDTSIRLLLFSASACMMCTPVLTTLVLNSWVVRLYRIYSNPYETTVASITSTNKYFFHHFSSACDRRLSSKRNKKYDSSAAPPPNQVAVLRKQKMIDTGRNLQFELLNDVLGTEYGRFFTTNVSLSSCCWNNPINSHTLVPVIFSWLEPHGSCENRARIIIPVLKTIDLSAWYQ